MYIDNLLVRVIVCVGTVLLGMTFCIMYSQLIETEGEIFGNASLVLGYVLFSVYILLNLMGIRSQNQRRTLTQAQ